jgi:hypothetical protein
MLTLSIVSVVENQSDFAAALNVSASVTQLASTELLFYHRPLEIWALQRLDSHSI